MQTTTLLEALADDIGFYVLMVMPLGVAIVVGFFARESRVALGIVAVFATLVCFGIGATGRAVMLGAMGEVAATPGLSRADRQTIMNRDQDEATYRLGVGLALALIPGPLALLVGRRKRERLSPEEPDVLSNESHGAR